MAFGNMTGPARPEAGRHRRIEPAVLYLGTPVVLISTLNGDGTVNVAPMSSAWWLGWSCMLGLDASSRTVENLLRTGECVLNLPSAAEAHCVDRLARLTGSPVVPRHKRLLGFRHEKDKLGAGGLSCMASEEISTPRLSECPVQLEAILVRQHSFAADDPRFLVDALAIEVKIVAVHACDEIISQSYADRIEPSVWKPLIMSFMRLFSRGEEIMPSRLAAIPEEAWGGRRPVPRGD